jgi:predicted dienelactone hydrolase
MRPFSIALLIGHSLTAAISTSTAAFAQTALTAATQPLPAASAPPGFRPWQGPPTANARPLEGALWYPPSGGGPTKLLFDSPIFQGMPVQQAAPVRPGRWPLVLLSHGVGGHWRSISWLGVGLAQQGAMVVAVNHPGSTYGDYNMRRSTDHGTRVNDLSTALDALLADPAVGPHIDRDRIYAAGFSLGGWTALSIGGLRGDLSAYTRYCAESGHRHCRDIAQQGGVDLTTLDAERWNRSYRDPRVKAVAAIDPALHHGLTVAQASDMVKPVLLIGLGQGADRLPDTDFSPPGSALTQILPGVRVEVMAPAFHFSALAVCKPEAPKLLAEDGDDPVCTDPPGTNRPALHEQIVHSMARHFRLAK